MGGARQIAAVLLAALLCAAALAACGSSSDSSTATTTARPAHEKPEGTGGGSPGGSQKPGGGSEKEEGGSESGGGSESSSGERSSSFRTPGGDNSIQEFGDEGDAGERAKATKTITTFYNGTAAEDWAAVCSVLSAKNVKAMKLFAKRIPKVKTADCPGVLAVVTASAQTKPPERIKGGVVSLRIEGETAFALYHGVDGKNYAFPLVLEGGEWRLTSLAPTPLTF